MSGTMTPASTRPALFERWFSPDVVQDPAKRLFYTRLHKACTTRTVQFPRPPCWRTLCEMLCCVTGNMKWERWIKEEMTNRSDDFWWSRLSREAILRSSPLAAYRLESSHWNCETGKAGVVQMGAKLVVNLACSRRPTRFCWCQCVRGS